MNPPERPSMFDDLDEEEEKETLEDDPIPVCEHSLSVDELPDDLNLLPCDRERLYTNPKRCWWHAEENQRIQSNETDTDLREPINGGRIDEVQLHGMELGDTISFEDCTLFRGIFSDADLEDANFRGADLRDANFAGADLRDADFKDADLTDTTFEDATVTGARFNGSRTVKTNFDGIICSRRKYWYLMIRTRILTVVSAARSLLSYMWSQDQVRQAFYIITLIFMVELIVRSIIGLTGSESSFSQIHQVAWTFVPLATELATSLTAFLIAGFAIVGALRIQVEEATGLIYAFRDGVYLTISAAVLGVIIQSVQSYLVFDRAVCTTIGGCLTLGAFLLSFYVFLFLFVGMILTARDIVDIMVDIL